MFGSGGGNFYALNAENGSLKWIYNSKHKTVNYPAAGAPKVFDGKVLIGYEVEYVSALNLEDGQLIWATPVLTNVGSLVNGNGDLYATSGTYVIGNSAGTNLYKINMDNGGIQWKQTFNYWILPPIRTNDGLYVAADLKIIAYG